MSWEYKETVLDKDPVIMASQLRELEARGWKWLVDQETRSPNHPVESIFRRQQGQFEES